MSVTHLKGYQSTIQERNIAWFLPRPKPDRYKGGMPLYCEKWLIDLAMDILDNQNPEILNLFCGMNQYGVRVDLNPEVEPDLLYDVHHVTDVLDDKFDIIIADPPYSTEEAKELYGTPPLNYKKWTGEADKLLKVGGLLIVYHKFVVPNPDPVKYNVAKRVFVGNRTWHLPRVAIYFQKHGFEVLK